MVIKDIESDRYNGITISRMVIRDIEFAARLSVSMFGCISSQTTERNWLKICTETEVCPGHCVSYCGVDCFSGPARGGPARGAENVEALC